jgi:low temperature requirement protein LtrA
MRRRHRRGRSRRRAHVTYIWTIAVAQVFWAVLAIVDLPIRETAVFGAALIGLEMSGPYIVERWKGGIPWNAGHIAERYGLLVIITLGEGIIGTVASINAVVHGPEGWSVDAGVVAFAGVGLTFAGGRTSRSRGPTSSGSTASARSSGATGTS